MQFIEMPIFQLGDAEILNILGKDEIHKYGFARRPGSIALGLLWVYKHIDFYKYDNLHLYNCNSLEWLSNLKSKLHIQ